MKSTTELVLKAIRMTLTLLFITQINPNQAIADSKNSKTKHKPTTISLTSKAKTKSTTYHFIGNTFSKKYHKPGCEFARKMNANHVLLIKTKHDANLAKYKECNWCMPKWTKSVSSKLLKSK